MDPISVVVIAIGLAMDAFAVSIASGLSTRSVKKSNALKIALSFGVFQALMPVLGWLAGLSLRDLISGIDHWIAFTLLLIIGGKMIYEALKLKEITDEADNCDISLKMLFILSIATSIDACAVGLTFAFLKVEIATPALVIGAITFALSFAGVHIGRRFGHLFESKIEVAGGIILIGIGTKILLDHLGYI